MTGGHLWAERYDREIGDIFALQDEISKRVVGALKVKLLPDELMAITTRPTKNTEAYECYLQARAALGLSWTNKATLRSARRLFERAVEIDPAYGKAYAGIADFDAFLWICGDIDASYQDMLSNSSKALDLAPNLAEAHASRGLALYLNGHANEAMEAFERAIVLDFELWAAHLFYAFSCKNTGKAEKAAFLYERAAQLNLNELLSYGMLADVYELLGQRDLSISAARRSMARTEAILIQRPGDAELLGFGAAILVFLGENAKAEDWAHRAILLDPESLGIRYAFACTHAVIGNSDAALESLEYIYSRYPQARQWFLGMVKHDTQFSSLRDRSEFQSLLRRLELETAGKA